MPFSHRAGSVRRLDAEKAARFVPVAKFGVIDVSADSKVRVAFHTCFSFWQIDIGFHFSLSRA